MTDIKLIIEGSTKSIKFGRLDIANYGNGVAVPAHAVVIGDFTEGETVVNNEYVAMTAKQHANIKAFLDEEVVYDADTDIVFPETNAQLKADINAQGNSIVAVISTNAEQDERLEKLERQAGAIEFDEWSMKGAILIGKLGTRNVCRIDLSADYDIDQVPYNDVAEDDGERLLTISKGGVTRKFHTFTSGDMGAIVDQASNPQPGTIVSQVPKPTT